MSERRFWRGLACAWACLPIPMWFFYWPEGWEMRGLALVFSIMTAVNFWICWDNSK
jgi:hypothetical protein